MSTDGMETGMAGFIDLDNVKAARIIVEHLAQRGHRRIAFIGGEVKLSANARDRHKGYVDGMKRLGLPVGERLVGALEALGSPSGTDYQSRGETER